MPATRLPKDATAAAPALLGRERQLAGIARAVDRVRAGRAQFVLIEGESGFGKTALLQAAVATVPLWPHRSAVGDENESELPYGVLNQLLATVEKDRELEPLLSGGVAPDVAPMVAGAALLALIDGSEGATCVTIDDAQWMDQPSAEALWFAGRRSFHDRLLVVIAARPDETSFLDRTRRLVADEERGVRLQVGGLAADQVSALVRQRTGLPTPHRLSASLVEATDGNVLHVQTLLNQAVSVTDPLGTLDRLLAGAPPLAPGFRAVTRQALERLRPPARAVIEVVAVLDDRSPITDVLAVASSYGAQEVDSADIDEALASGLITLDADDTIRMPHQRVRTVLVGDLPLRARRRLHAAAGTVIGGHRGLGHRVHAASGPDEELAGELDAAAALAAANHEVERAFRYARWSASLSSVPADKERRVVDAGVYALSGRRTGLLVRAVMDFENLSAGPEREVLLGNAALASGDILAGRRHLLQGATAGPSRSTRARAMSALGNEILGQLALAEDSFDESLAFSRAALDTLADLRTTSDGRADGANIDVDEVEANVVCCHALAIWRSGRGNDGQERIDELIAGARRRGLLPKDGVLFLARGTFRRQQLRLDEAITDLETGIGLTDRGRPEFAPYGRIELALAQFRKGDWDAAAATAAGAASLADDLQFPWLHATSYAIAAMVPAARGDHKSAEAWLSGAEAGPEQHRSASLRRLGIFVRVLAARSAGDTATVTALVRSAIATEPVNALIERSWWEELLAAAATPAAITPPADPLAALSSREREVAHLAAQGLTNREVAEKLFVSVKGVEYHMGNVLAKLNLNSRRGIRRLIERSQNVPEGN